LPERPAVIDQLLQHGIVDQNIRRVGAIIQTARASVQQRSDFSEADLRIRPAYSERLKK
jgi:hypothetical protein